MMSHGIIVFVFDIDRRELAYRGYRENSAKLSHGSLSVAEAVSLVHSSTINEDISSSFTVSSLLTGFEDHRCSQHVKMKTSSTNKSSVFPPSYRNLDDDVAPTVVVYQNKNSYTGGTTALLILAEELMGLGYHTYICNDTNRASMQCRSPDRKHTLVLYRLR
jgi:hypothetical protein